MDIKFKKQSVIYIFLCIMLFFPIKFIHLYYAILLCYIFLIFYIYKVTFTAREVYIYSLISVVIMFLFFLRYVLIDVKFLDVRDVFEYGKLVLISFSLILFLKIRLNYNFLFLILEFYLVFDILISLAQFFSFKNDFVELVTHLYSSPNQIENSLSVSSRALGLSGDPSAHGIMILFIVSILSIKMFFYDDKIFYKNISLFFLGMFTILLSQSQTAFVGLIVLLVILAVTSVYYRRSLVSPNQVFMLFGLLSMFGTYIFYIFFDKLRYLFTLFTHGLQRSSYVAREDTRSYILNMVYDYPYALVLTGLGKNFFGSYSTSMDNEHLYMLVVWGGLFYLIFIFLLMYSLYLFIKRKCCSNLFFTIPFIIGLPLAWPSAYYLVPKISLLLVLFYSFHYHSEKKRI